MIYLYSESDHICVAVWAVWKHDRFQAPKSPRCQTAVEGLRWTPHLLQVSYKRGAVTGSGFLKSCVPFQFPTKSNTHRVIISLLQTMSDDWKYVFVTYRECFVLNKHKLDFDYNWTQLCQSLLIITSNDFIVVKQCEADILVFVAIWKTCKNLVLLRAKKTKSKPCSPGFLSAASQARGLSRD